MSSDLDYATARLHGRRSLMAEAGRLDSLCRIRTVAELARSLFPEGKLRSITELQQRLVEDLAKELCELVDYVPKTRVDLFERILVRFEVENLKVILRGLATHRRGGGIEGFLVPVCISKSLAWDARALTLARSVEELIQMLPHGVLREALEASVARGLTQVFFMEAALDAACFRELLAGLHQLPSQDQEVIKPVVIQEVDIFHLMLVVRGKFFYGLQADLLLPLHVEGTQISKKRFEAMLGDQELAAAAIRAGGVLDVLPTEVLNVSQRLNPGIFEVLAWKRYLRMANRAFRQDPVGFGAVFGYVAIRRIEVANLVTISEGIRAGLDSKSIRDRLIELEGAHV